MRSIHTTKQQDHKNNTPYRVIHKHRTKLGNPIRGIILSSASIIALSSILLVSGNVTYAEGNGSSVSLSVDNSDTVLELTVPESVSLDLTPSSANNYNPSGTANLAISAGTNNITGYTLTMSVPSTNLVNSSVTLSSSNNPNHIPLDNDNHPIIPTITSTYSDSNFPDNTWGYRIGNTNYSPVPSSIELASTNSAGNATTTTLELAAKVNSAQPAGTYTTTFNIAATAKQSIFTVNWNANGGTVSPTTGIYRYGSQIGTLPEPTYTGYDFLGWFTQATGGEQISETTTVTADVTYWAQWEKANPFNSAFANAGKSKQNGYYVMQDMTTSICSAITTPTTTTENISTQLIDTRDNKVYWVSKLKDGNCWMTQNLDFNIVAGTTYTNADTDLKLGKTWTPTASTYKTNNNSWDSPVTTPESYDPGELCWDGVLDASLGGGWSLDNTTKACETEDEKHYHVGNYYNWTAAVAMNDSSAHGDPYEDIDQSICPAGWMLPKDGSVNTDDVSFFNLTLQYGNSDMWQGPLYFPMTGYWGGSSSGVGLYVSYWSPIVAYGYSSFHFLFYSNGYTDYYGTERYSGYSVRCVAR